MEKVIGVSDYGIKIGDKVKTFHANMLKEYVERESRSDAEREKTEVVVLSASGRADVVAKEDDCQPGGAVPVESGQEAVGGSVLHVAAAAIIEQSESGPEEAVDDGNLLELDGMQPKETANDITFGSQLDDHATIGTTARAGETLRAYLYGHAGKC